MPAIQLPAIQLHIGNGGGSLTYEFNIVVIGFIVGFLVGFMVALPLLPPTPGPCGDTCAHMMPDVCPSAGCFHRNLLEMYGMEVLAARGFSLPAPSPPTRGSAQYHGDFNQQAPAPLHTFV